MGEPTIAVLRNISNCPIVQISSRKYPGVVIQGDSLRSLLQLVRELRSALEARDFEEADDAAEQLEDSVGGFIELYEEVLEELGIELPYVRMPPSSEKSAE